MAEQRWPVSRRSFLRGTVAAGVASAGAVAGAPGVALGAPPGRRVAVLGGGVAGLSAAHELIERGFEVTVYEARAFGGKARSVGVPGTGRDGRPDLPGEHGFRFFPGFYQNLPDTMRRIPVTGNAEGVWNNLVTVPEARFSRRDGDDITLALPGEGFPAATTPEAIRETLAGAITTLSRMPAEEAGYFANRLLVFNSSCEARRFGQWEHTSWHDFVQGHQRSREFRAIVSRSLTSIMVAAKEDLASTRTIGSMGEQFLGNPLGIGNDGGLDRVLNNATNIAWIDPWVEHLRGLGVRFELGARVTELVVRDKRIGGARISGVGTVEADYYVVALPVEQARKLWSPQILALAPEFAAMDRLFVDWMNGIQIYFRSPLHISRGHTAFVDSPWSLTSISQNQLWTRALSSFGDGTVADCLSIDISDWHTPGVLYGKPAVACTHEEIYREVWAQLTAHLNDREQLLRPAEVHSWFLDPGITWQGARNANADPLLINTAGSWDSRPVAHGPIENLFLAGDYVRTDVDLATMEGANESARAAVNALLDVSGSPAPRCDIVTLRRTPELEPLRVIDADRYAKGLPNLFDVPV
ncbi:hydroxysqualene dehydroxylase [Nocardia mangyaensis]|uniref:hydroxysqualene dehydroxylase n=1 Tax=Nocardia mangyaensis TaxID=2213200 RepID=UPI00267565B3|nr:FAD-dependent oxidoreductase [Nocardia mangyaensis]MDO3650767.1 FAD-dependent oxidoreductase [Nocardia mangyaensis]